KVIGFAPALKLDVPGTVNGPVCVIAPVLDIVKLLPTVEVVKVSGVVLVRLTLLLPLLLNVTAPVKALFCVKVIGFAPALNDEVPATVITPVCVIAPPAVRDRL